MRKARSPDSIRKPFRSRVRRSSPARTGRTAGKPIPTAGDEFLRAVQARTARVAVGASAVRGVGNAGTATAARSFLAEMDLWQFSHGPTSFAVALDGETEKLQARLPRAARRWGLARKLLNIFLRDCLYNSYLAPEFRLVLSEMAFELPLDSITGERLDRLCGWTGRDGWPGVKYLTPGQNMRYQAAAAGIAAELAIARVHLDTFWWAAERQEPR